MAEHQLSEGKHEVTVSIGLAGYAPMKFIIEVSSTGAVTCVSVNDDAAGCDNTVAPKIDIGGTVALPTVTIHLAEVIVVSHADWITSKGGAAGLKDNLGAVGEIIDGYLGADIGFTVVLGDVGTTIDYYLG